MCLQSHLFRHLGAPFDHQSLFYSFFLPSPEGKIDCRLSLIRVNSFSFPYYILNQSHNYVASLPECVNYLPHCCRAGPPPGENRALPRTETSLTPLLFIARVLTLVSLTPTFLVSSLDLQRWGLLGGTQNMPLCVPCTCRAFPCAHTQS